MYDRAEHRAAMAELVAGRRRAGQPVWDRTLHLADVFHNQGITYEERRDAIVERIRRSGWLDGASEDLTDLIDELAEAEDVNVFDQVWNMVYDQADADRVWIATR